MKNHPDPGTATELDHSTVPVASTTAPSAGGVATPLTDAVIQRMIVEVDACEHDQIPRLATTHSGQWKALASKLESDRSELIEALRDLRGAKDCGFCPNQGWYPVRNRRGEPEQQQCEFCETTPDSVFNVRKRTDALLSRLNSGAPK